MNYLIYKITNTANNKIYIGCHKTQDINDGYMGSGKLIKRAINKYGLEKFTKVILHNFSNSEDMFDMEGELVNEDFVTCDDTYNIMEGGKGGWDYVHNSGLSGSSKGGLTLHISDEELSKQISNGVQATYDNGRTGVATYGMLNKHHSATTKQKMSESSKNTGLGDNNSQAGSRWITNDEINKKIKKDQPIPEGFRKGRNMSHINYKK